MRTFIAVWPDDETRRQLSSLDLGNPADLRPVEAGQWHVTLRFLGDVDDGSVALLFDALGEAAGKLVGPVTGLVGPSTAWFAGDRTLMIPVAGLDEAAGAVRAATAPLVPLRDRGKQPFSGHLTIARSRGRRADPDTRAALTGIPFSSAFPVGSIDLVVSRAEADSRVRYSTLGRVPLGG